MSGTHLSSGAGSSSSEDDGAYDSDVERVRREVLKLSEINWTIHHFESVGIFFESESRSLDEIFEMVNLPRICLNPALRMFKTVMKETLTFSIPSFGEILCTHVMDPLPRSRILENAIRDIDDAITNLWVYKRKLKSDGGVIKRIQRENDLKLSSADLSLFIE